jgi:release factor glutamine methyltransferase
VRLYEPGAALFAGPLGLDLNQRLLDQAAPLLAPGGTLALELDPAQAEPLTERARIRFPGAEISLPQDLRGLARVLCVQAR